MGKDKNSENRRPRRNLALAAGLLALTVAVYLPALGGGFVWDDDSMLTDNVVLKENGLYRSWLTTEQPNYWPITWTSYWLEFQIWGLNPAGYHAANVGLHALNTLLLWRILPLLNVPAPWVAAAVFAVHPVNVESVAWITQRKNTLSLFFFLLALLFYLRFDGRRVGAWYWTALALFILAMLSKGTVVALPAVILLCVWWLRGTIARRDLLQSLPFFAVSAVLSLVEIWFQYVRAIGADVVRDDSFFARLAGAGWVVWFYLYKTLLPIHLSFIYPRWKIDPLNWLSYVPDLALIGLLGLCWSYRKSWGRPALFALGYFIVTLGPVLGFFDFYFMKYSFVADHYLYVSISGIIALIVCACRGIFNWGGRRRAAFARVGTATALIALGLLTWRQSGIYRDHETLWRKTLQQNPNASLAHNNLGFVLERKGEVDKAISHYLRAIELDPNLDKAYSNLGFVFASRGQLGEAVKYYRQLLRIRPEAANAQINLGNILYSLGQLSEAESHFRRALSIKPGDAGLYNNLAVVLISQGKIDEAVSNLDEAVRLDPNHAGAHFNLGRVLADHGQLERSIEHFRHVLRIDPRRAAVHESLARALARLGRNDEAIKHYQEALRIIKSQPQADTPPPERENNFRR